MTDGGERMRLCLNFSTTARTSWYTRTFTMESIASSSGARSCTQWTTTSLTLTTRLSASIILATVLISSLEVERASTRLTKWRLASTGAGIRRGLINFTDSSMRAFFGREENRVEESNHRLQVVIQLRIQYVVVWFYIVLVLHYGYRNCLGLWAYSAKIALLIKTT